MIAIRVLVAATLTLAMVGSVAAAGVPAAAMNKTITISFTASGTAKEPDGRTHAFSTSVTRVVYISGAGRLFMRHTATSKAGSAGGDFDPAAQSAGRGGSFSFQGDKMVGVLPYAGGARQITATFDAGFSSCSASVIEGNSGSGSFMRKGPGGVTREITNATTSGVTCSIQSGNAFAQ